MIVLTGATGFFGKNLFRRLMEWEEPIRLLVRSTSSFHRAFPEFADQNTVELVEIDFSSESVDVTPYLSDASIVIHAAAHVSLRETRLSSMQRTNVESTSALVRALLPSTYFLYIGSVVVYGPTGDVPGDERQVFPVDYRSPYEVTKRAATMFVRDAAMNGKRCGILHPGIIYGPGAHGSLTKYARAVAHKRLPALVNGSSRASFVHIEDVVEAAIEMIKRREEDEFIAGGEISTLQGFFVELARQTGGKAPSIQLSARKLEQWLKFPAQVAGLFGIELPITPTLMRMAQCDWAFQSTKARRLLGIHFRDLRQGIADWIESEPLQ